ncbi:MAG: peptidylprolyl isomerase [Polaribacter sp.]|jgi:peptidyl-prolyl cis-trans isomerase SurA|uniref:peptidylprolyl isomerase n=1 Tax=Polaribacter sp. TaxID=1920175 RepID=UPI00261BAE15|nr:peptidylprolyl isomerase [Polaribacter sp.]MBT3742265.1 peptidylprolyl isomerase [Polaribacter sp.]MBT7815378.1 peptidylprolyl isomerase [Polaribacter sp.]MDG1194466.1 peptidylprolyl isomerase [Polaribacter sp.]MDG1403445.1 peptidylprolyl isomerase [Polaribacter sp.]
MKKLILLVVLCFSSVLFSQKKSKVLLTIDGEKITVSDFKRVYEKNLDAIDNEDAKDVEKNLDLYINYKLKVKEAYHIKLDTLPSYRKEIETYKNQLSAPYMQDTVFINKLVKDAYFRTKNEVKAKHILIKTPKSLTPKDTLLAYQKITEIRNRVLNGEDFEIVARETSEDPSARDDAKSGRKGNNGNLGYFSAFRMLYSFETAAYNTKVGEVSKPFRTRYGYHILKVDAFRTSKGEVEVAHILLNDKGAKGEELINDIYKKLQADEQFKALARKYSDDTGTKTKGGKLRKFGTGVMVKPFEEVAFSLQKEGEYSKPFKTRFGWHILQLTKKHPVLSFKELEKELKNKVRSGDRAQLSKDAVIHKLKNKYSISENEEAKRIFDRKDIKTMSKDSMQAIILSINDKKITQEEFFGFLKSKRNKPVFEIFNEFKNREILAYYKENLEKTEPEFAEVLQEYRDGLLLFELMQQKIWEKSSKDTLGLKSFFDANLSKYQPKELKKIKGEVINDYQNFLEKNWIADLRRKSVIQVEKRQLKKIIKAYSSK